ncbi:hypothetical protein STRDD11_02455 [Streptococcus sp. DD11]|nr:hypothetical protein STRDD11_02455 [Streptococcus sp. DD11]
MISHQRSIAGGFCFSLREKQPETIIKKPLITERFCLLIILI